MIWERISLLTVPKVSPKIIYKSCVIYFLGDLYPLRVLVDLVHHRKSAKTRIIKRKQCLLHLHLALGPVVSSPKISEVKVLYQRMRNRCVWTLETLCKSSWKTLVPNASLKDFSATSECPGSLGTAVHMVVTLTSAEESLFNVLLALLE